MGTSNSIHRVALYVLSVRVVLAGFYEIKYIGDYLLPDTKLMGKTNFTKTAYQR